jgi:hypothetical protein
MNDFMNDSQNSAKRKQHNSVHHTSSKVLQPIGFEYLKKGIKKGHDYRDPFLKIHIGCLHHTLIEHGIGHLYETGNVGALHIVDVIAILSVLHTGLMNALHDVMQALVNLFSGP